MDILMGLAGLVVGAVAAWQLARARLEERIGYWQGEAERARAAAERLTEQTAAWAAGCQQGREEVLSVARALSARIVDGGCGDIGAP